MADKTSKKKKGNGSTIKKILNALAEKEKRLYNFEV